MESSNFKFELLKHFINRKVLQELFQQKKIQIIQKTPQILSDIDEKVKEKDEKLIYGVIKKELSKDYSNFRYLAKGNQGYVILAKENQTNKRFAIKGYSVRDEEGEVEIEQQLNDAKNEIEILSQCRGSPYVSNLIKSIDVQQNQFLYLVFTEYQGTFEEVIQSTQEKRLNEISAIKYSKDIAEGLLYIHKKGYLVNDLKMDNILIDYSGNAVVSDLGVGQKLKKNDGYAYNEYQGNIYFQAPECVDSEFNKIYEDEYKKLGVETQMNPSQRSEACSLGYLIYTMIQGKKPIHQFQNEKHKPLVYDDNFKSLKYSKQLQYIIDGLTKFVPRQRLSIAEAYEKLKEIISIEFNLNQTFLIQVSEKTQIQSQNQFKGIEFIENFDKKYYPLVQNEESFLKELISQKDSSNDLLEKLKQSQNESISLKEDNKNLKIKLKDKEKQISKLEAIIQQNLSSKEQEISSLKGKLQSKKQEVENLQNNLQIQNQNLSLQYQQESLQVIIQKKDQFISQLENELSFQKQQNKKLKQKILDLENQMYYFQENQDKADKKIVKLKKIIQKNSKEAQQKIQQLEQEKNLDYQGIKKVNSNFQFPQKQRRIIDVLETQNFGNNLQQTMSHQQNQQQDQMFLGTFYHQEQIKQPRKKCVIFKDRQVLIMFNQIHTKKAMRIIQYNITYNKIEKENIQNLQITRNPQFKNSKKMFPFLLLFVLIRMELAQNFRRPN